MNMSYFEALATVYIWGIVVWVVYQLLKAGWFAK